MKYLFYRVFITILAFLLSSFLLSYSVFAKSTIELQKSNLIREVKTMGEHEKGLFPKGFNKKVLATLASVPREEFIPKKLRQSAYLNRPLPIGYGQTISQPYIVAVMTDLLNLKASDKVLEIGTGSGYQAAILAKLVKHVYSMEIIPPLAKHATRRLKRLGFDNVTVLTGDGYYGIPKQAPFNKIIVTAAANHVPYPLIEQLAKNGTIIIPIGSRYAVQHLMLIEKDAKGKISTRQLMAVRFVPFTGAHD